MELHIGIEQVDGSVQYITILNRSGVIPILKNFYCKESIVAALLALGDIVALRPTPYGKYRGFGDVIHCRAEIRDDKAKKGKHLAKYADTIEIYSKIDGFNLIYSDGIWRYFRGTTPTEVDFTEIPSTPKDCLKDLTIHELNISGSLSNVHNNRCISWCELQNQAITNNKTYYLFRNNKLAATINHPLNQAV